MHIDKYVLQGQILIKTWFEKIGILYLYIYKQQ